MNSAQQKRLLQDFSEMTGYSARQAQATLRKYNYDIERALDATLSATDNIVGKSIGEIFDRYKETEKEIGIDGTIQYIQDLKLELEDPVVLAIAKQLEAKETGRFERAGFIHGWSLLKCDSLDRMKQAVQAMKTNMATNDAYFTQVYMFTFTYNLNDGQRLLLIPNLEFSKICLCVNLPAFEAAIDYWRLLLSGKFVLLEEWIHYVQSVYKKNISKDTWSMIWDFARYLRQDPQLAEYDSEGAWPSVIDEFVGSWKTENELN